MNAGEIVRFKPEWLASPAECGQLYVVVEDRGDRVLIEPWKTDLLFVPRELVRTEMLEVVDSRIVEVYVGISYGNDSGHWFTESVDVPRSLPEEEAARLALDIAKARVAEMEEDFVVFFGIYHYWSDEEMAEYEAYGEEGAGTNEKEEPND